MPVETQIPNLNPIPNGQTRVDVARRVREEAAEIVTHRTDPITQRNNGETDKHNFLTTFTKGLKHDDLGFVDADDLKSFVDALNQDSDNDESASPFPGTYTSGKPAPFLAKLYDGTFRWPEKGGKPRTWESPLAGHSFEINGPDADHVAMPPAPKVGSDELTAEMAEVYGMALIRDVPFVEWGTSSKVADLVDSLKGVAFYQGNITDPNARVKARRKARNLRGGVFDPDLLFRGSTPGSQKGGYISQFLLIGSKERAGFQLNAVPDDTVAEPDAINRAGRFADPEYVTTKGGQAQSATEPLRMEGITGAGTSVGHAFGLIRYGAQTINQRLVPHKEGLDHLTDWHSWCDVQNGANRKDFDDFNDTARFIHTPRDLATYVHYDALYQAYLNACLILIAEGAATDIGLPEGAGHPTRDAFALFGGPHVLTLVTEVATRALKAVRRQKYNIHLRARPEAVAAAITLAWNGEAKADDFASMQQSLGVAGLLTQISDWNTGQNAVRRNGADGAPGFPSEVHEDKNALLPMAFPEGSPMHPSYGAGHATVAGACTTILKAFFEMYVLPNSIVRATTKLDDIIAEGSKKNSDWFGDELSMTTDGLGIPHEYEPNADGTELRRVPHEAGLTVQGELDKLSANIAIGRDFAGVHYYTDYYESLRMGERIAVGLLQEQMLTYREPVSMRFTSFDGDRVMITGSGGTKHTHNGSDKQDALIHIWDQDCQKVGISDWWNRALDQDAETL